MASIVANNSYVEYTMQIRVTPQNVLSSWSIKFQFGNLSGYINANGGVSSSEIKYNKTTIPFTIPKTFYAEMPNTTSKLCTLTYTEYLGMTKLATLTTQFTVSTNPALCKPTLKGTLVDANSVTAALTASKDTFVRFASTIRCRLEASAVNSATLKSVRIHNTSRTTSLESLTYTLNILQPDLEAVLFEATDSRGYSTRLEVPVNLIPYVPLTNNAVAKRTDPTSGNVSVDLTGNGWKGDFGRETNTIAYKIEYEGAEIASGPVDTNDDYVYSLSVDLSGFDYRTSHQLLVTVYDSVSSIPLTVTVRKGIPVFEWGETDFKFNVPVDMPGLTINGVSLEQLIRSIIEGG